jgi:hypothetical protein
MPPGVTLSPRTARQIISDEAPNKFVTTAAAKLLDAELKKLAKRVAKEAVHLSDSEHKCSIRPRHIQAALNSVGLVNHD